MRYLVAVAVILSLAGCSGNRPGVFGGFGKKRNPPAAAPVVVPPDSFAGNPFSEPIEEPPSDAATVEEFDTTTPEQRAAMLETGPPAGGEDGRLGTTIASLGDPAEPGFWIKTPLVSEPVSGRAVYAASGRSVQVQLLPSGGAAGSGSQVSLTAMRLLDAPLTELPELVLYKNL